MSMHPEQLARLLINEAILSRKLTASLLVFIPATVLFAGMLWPPQYVASTTILVGEKNIIQPLMQGAAVATEATDRARIAREVIYGRKILNRVLDETGWSGKNLSAAERDNLIKDTMRRTTVSNVGRDLIKIEYRDDDPERAYLTARRYAELFIAESMTAKAAESQSAFDFIDKQVQEYYQKLLKAEESLREFRSANLDAQPGMNVEIGARLNTLQTRIEEATQQMKETEIRKLSLEKQLSGEAETATAATREGQYRARVAELQSQIDTLRLSYHETYPDIIMLRHQISDLNEAIAAEQKRRKAARAAGRVQLDDTVVNNPMYQQLKHELYQTQVQLDTLRARIVETRREMQQELEREKRVHGSEATLVELTRDYQVNRDIYQDLFKRRENARMSMSIDRDKQGLVFRIQEPAMMPSQPSGPRFWHFVAGAVLLGIAVPFGLLYAKVRMDPRIRLSAVIVDRHKVPVLVTVPHLWPPGQAHVARRDVRLTLMTSMMFVVLAFYVLLFLRRVM